MRDDLLDAQASIDWAVSQLPSFSERIDTWIRHNLYVDVEDVPAPASHNPIVAIKKASLPLSFNVEVGAYINAIRSSLDILATALANRDSISDPENAYFPVARNYASFVSGNYKGAKFVKGLPASERLIIESLKPYDGGNQVLWTLHYLDIMRKHRRLIDVDVRPITMHLAGQNSLAEDFIPIATGWIRVNEKTVVGLLRKGAPNYDMKVTAFVAFNESGPVERKPVTAALIGFADMADSIIHQFDHS